MEELDSPGAGWNPPGSGACQREHILRRDRSNARRVAPARYSTVRSVQLRRITAATIALLIAFPCGVAPASNNALEFQGTWDASAGAQITDEVFVVASEEDNALRFYSWASADLPIAEQDLWETGAAGNGHRSGRSTRRCRFAGIGFELLAHPARRRLIDQVE